MQTKHHSDNAAITRLQSEGYEVLTRNYKNTWGQIDIVAKDDTQVVFVAVQTKTEGVSHVPWEVIDRHKLKQMENMGHLWCEEYGWEGQYRIDAVGVWLDSTGDVTRIEHWENVQIWPGI